MTTVSYSFDLETSLKYGVFEAILIQHLAYWISYNRRRGVNFIEGRTWTFQTQEEISAHFPFWDRQQVNHLIAKLVDQGVLIKGNFNRKRWDKTLWYAFKNEEMFTKVKSDPSEKLFEKQGAKTEPVLDENSPGASLEWSKVTNRMVKSDQAIPHTLTNTLKVNDINDTRMPAADRPVIGSLTSLKKPKEKRSTSVPDVSQNPIVPEPKPYKLNASQKQALDWLLSQSELSGTVGMTLSWWAKTYPLERLKDCFAASINAKRTGPVGAYMNALLIGKKVVPNQSNSHNRKWIEGLLAKVNWPGELKINLKYLRVAIGQDYKEIDLNLPHEDFKRIVQQAYETVKAYKGDKR